MKLFQWAHRKFRQNSIDTFKDFTFGNPCTCLTVQPTLDDQYSNTKPSLSNINQTRFSSYQQENQVSYSEFGDNRDEEKSQEEKSKVISDLFQGFLTIGTLGAETFINEPATPTFAIPLEDITERDAEVTENDLKLISYELEKFLEAENKEKLYDSSGRNSYVSTITLSGKQLDEAEEEEYKSTTLCPLQGYLFGSSTEVPETITGVRKERASLAELFHRTEITNQDSIVNGENKETGKTEANQTHKSAMHIIRKMFKKVQTSPRSSSNSGSDVATISASTTKKFHKVLNMFHRKVHPENSSYSTNAKNFIKSHKGKIRNITHGYCNGNDTGDPRHSDKSRRFHSESKSRKHSQPCKTNWNPPQQESSLRSSHRNREHWIKTDAEYLLVGIVDLVLEL